MEALHGDYDAKLKANDILSASICVSFTETKGKQFALLFSDTCVVILLFPLSQADQNIEPR